MEPTPTARHHDDEARLLVVASMIVGDESTERVDCLASIADFVDHIVVCDTGSADDTRDARPHPEGVHARAGREVPVGG
jgi:hypothetical protein